MAPPAISDNKGMTLIEVLISLLLFLIVALALLQTSILSMDQNVANVLRDEAVSIADQRMSELRDKSIDDPDLNDTGGLWKSETSITRNIRNASVSFTPKRRISTVDQVTRRVEVEVDWTWMGKTMTHNISSIARSQ